MACQTLSLATLLPRGHKTSPFSQGIAGTRAGIALWESGAQLLQVERGRQRHNQRGQWTRPRSHSKSVAELNPGDLVHGLPMLKERQQLRPSLLLKLTPTWSHGSQVGA